MSELGVVFYRAPSLLTGDPIVGLVTGLDAGSQNAKTGPMAQAYILREDLPPMDAKRANLDDAICGDCKLRGHDGVDSGCYVTVWNGPGIVWKQYQAGVYPTVTWPELQAVLEGRSVRLGAYGDPAAIPFDIWRTLLRTVAGWVGYTHQFRICDPRFKTILMASVDTIDEFHMAHLAGWRTFRIRLGKEALLTSNKTLLGSNQHVARLAAVPLEFVCPASDEAGHRTTCQQCQLCRGTSSPARSVAIVAHGKPSNLKAFGIDVRGKVGRRARHIESTLNPSGIQLIPLLRSKDYGKEAGERLAKVRP